MTTPFTMVPSIMINRVAPILENTSLLMGEKEGQDHPHPHSHSSNNHNNQKHSLVNHDREQISTIPKLSTREVSVSVLTTDTTHHHTKDGRSLHGLEEALGRGDKNTSRSDTGMSTTLALSAVRGGEGRGGRRGEGEEEVSSPPLLLLTSSSEAVDDMANQVTPLDRPHYIYPFACLLACLFACLFGCLFGCLISFCLPPLTPSYSLYIFTQTREQRGEDVMMMEDGLKKGGLTEASVGEGGVICGWRPRARLPFMDNENNENYIDDDLSLSSSYRLVSVRMAMAVSNASGGGGGGASGIVSKQLSQGQGLGQRQGPGRVLAPGQRLGHETSLYELVLESVANSANGSIDRGSGSHGHNHSRTSGRAGGRGGGGGGGLSQSYHGHRHLDIDNFSKNSPVSSDWPLDR